MRVSKLSKPCLNLVDTWLLTHISSALCCLWSVSLTGASGMKHFRGSDLLQACQSIIIKAACHLLEDMFTLVLPFDYFWEMTLKFYGTSIYLLISSERRSYLDKWQIVSKRLKVQRPWISFKTTSPGWLKTLWLYVNNRLQPVSQNQTKTEQNMLIKDNISIPLQLI